MGFSVYIHKNKVNGKKYIGITSMNPEQRWLNGKAYKKNKKFWDDIEKYGWDGFDHIIFAEDLTDKEAILLEQQLIEEYHTVAHGYNNSYGGTYAFKNGLCHELNQVKNGSLRRGGIFEEYLILLDPDKTSIPEEKFKSMLNWCCFFAFRKIDNCDDFGDWWRGRHYEDEMWLAYFWGVFEDVILIFLRNHGLTDDFFDEIANYSVSKKVRQMISGMEDLLSGAER